MAGLVDLPLPDHFRGFAAVVENDGGTTYPAICRGVADDPDVLALLDGAPLPQRRPLLLLAAVHDLLLSGDEHPLASYYDTVAAVRGGSFESPGGDVVAVFTDFCRERSDPLRQLVSSRNTQTNEVGRCSALLPGLCHVAADYRGAEALALLDLGTSAGLNLLFDDYAYTYRPRRGDGSEGFPAERSGGDDHRVRRAGAAASAVSLECTVRGDPGDLPDLRLPAISARVGLDLAPVDATAETEARWLLACQWPDNPARFGRLRAALANRRTAADPPRLERGDMVTDLARVAATIDDHEPLVVFHSWVAAYLDEAQQRALADGVQALRADRRVHHLYLEAAFETPGLPTPPPPEPRDGPDLASALVHVGPDGQPERLADAHPHGYWIRWW
jgi:hypothetical protein